MFASVRLSWDGAGPPHGCADHDPCLPPPAVPPLPSLNPGPALEEGQGLTLAASCTAEGSPAPSVTWDTEVKGTASSRAFKHSRSAAVTSEFHLVPSRSMNGQPLTCVVSHPGLLQDQRITHVLQVACEYLDLGQRDPEPPQCGQAGCPRPPCMAARALVPRQTTRSPSQMTSADHSDPSDLLTLSVLLFPKEIALLHRAVGRIGHEHGIESTF